MDNAEWVRRIREGDLDAFAEMVDHYQNALYSAAYQVLGDFHAAQDIAQEAFIKAYMHMPSLQKPERLGSWLYSIAYRLSLNALRSRQRHEPLDLHSHIADEAPVDEAVLRRSERRRVWQALDALEERNRAPVVLHYFGGQSVPEIANLLCITEDAAESRIRRARKQLKKELVSSMEQLFANEKLKPSFKQRVLGKIVHKEPFTLAGCMVAAPFPELGKQVRAAVKTIYGCLDRLPGHRGRDIYCVIPPQTLDPGKPMLFVGVWTDPSASIPDELERMEVPAQKYAVSTFKGTLDQYDEFFRSIPGVISGEGFEPLNMWQSYCFELYPENAYDWSDDSAVQEIRQHWAIK